MHVKKLGVTTKVTPSFIQLIILFKEINIFKPLIGKQYNINIISGCLEEARFKLRKRLGYPTLTKRAIFFLLQKWAIEPARRIFY